MAQANSDKARIPEPLVGIHVDGGLCPCTLVVAGKDFFGAGEQFVVNHSRYLPIVCEIKGEIKIMRFEQLHYTLQVVFAGTSHANCLTLDLALGFGEFFADEFGDTFGFVLVEAFAKRHLPRHFEVAGDWFFGGIQCFLRNLPRAKTFAQNVGDAVQVKLVVASDSDQAIAGFRVKFHVSTCTLKVVAGCNLPLCLVDSIMHF